MAGNLKCKFCGREVRNTVHSKKLPLGFKVDYYLVWTGDLVPIIMKDPKSETEVSQFFKVEKLHPLVACADCFAKTEVKDELEHQFKDVPETTPEENEDGK